MDIVVMKNTQVEAQKRCSETLNPTDCSMPECQNECLQKHNGTGVYIYLHRTCTSNVIYEHFLLMNSKDNKLSNSQLKRFIFTYHRNVKSIIEKKNSFILMN